MNPGSNQASSAHGSRTASPQAPRKYRSTAAGRTGDFTLSPGQDASASREDRDMITTILLAEDNDDLRSVMETYLAMMNYGVLPCPDGQVAAETFRSSIRIDALISDLEMPGKSGLELARELTQLCPNLPVMIVSGAHISSDMAFEMESRNWKFLPKPCRLPLILSTIESLLRPDVRQAA